MHDFVSGMGRSARIAVAYVLFLLLGLTGAHRWFLGRYRTALAMTLNFVVMILAAAGDHDALGGFTALIFLGFGIIDLFYIPIMASNMPDDAYSFGWSLASSTRSSNLSEHEAANLKVSLNNVQQALAEAKSTIDDMNSHFDEEYETVTTRLKQVEAESSSLKQRLGAIHDLDEEEERIKTRIHLLETVGMQAAQDRIDEVERRRIELESRLGPVALFDQQKTEMQAVLDRIRLVSIPAAQAEVDAIRSEHSDRRASLDLLVHEIAKVEERISFAELGIYEPHFDFADSEGYRVAIERVRREIKEAITYDRAVECTTAWTVGNSEKEGERMIKRQKKLTLRAFNGEADTAIASVRWNNVTVMENRILRSQSAIDKANESLRMTISAKYVTLKLKELRLVHEHREKQRQEKEALKEEQRAQREEEELQRRALEAEREGARYQRMLDKAMAEAARGDKSAELRKRIAQLEQNIADAAAEKERAKAMAELTKCGYVYIISNVGSFGEDVVKIGLTRRLEPEDRVRELSGASVPFSFDIHAMIYSEQAPELERALHREFDARRVNMANPRKEFFRCDLDRIEAAVHKVAPDAHFTRDVAGDEWRQTVDMRSKRLEGAMAT